MREKKRLKARKTLIDFIRYNKKDYQIADFHLKLATILDKFIKGETKQKIMVFAPPQHGKSELVSRQLPAFALGLNPDLKVAGCSYNSTKAGEFNRDVQKIIDSPEYHAIFPNTYLNASNVRDSAKGGALRNTNIFETVGHAGFYKSVGVGGALTGTTVDLGIIDDPIKDDIEANSAIFRERVWQWYIKVFSSRLHDDSKQLLTLTRWHEDDLAGRLLKTEPDEWDVVIFKAIDENEKALWPERHGFAKLDKIREKFPSTWQSMYQQNPTKEEGNIVKRDWFGRFRMSELPPGLKVYMMADLAYTAKERNDPSGFLVYIPYKGNFYLIDYMDVRYEFGPLMDFMEDLYKRHGIALGYVENKGPGKSAVQMLRERLPVGMNVKEYKVPGIDKEARLRNCLPDLEGGRVFLLEGAGWHDTYLNSMCAFPKGAHDEAVDCTTGMIRQHKTGFTITKGR